jgi:DnaK suppressor protein
MGLSEAELEGFEEQLRARAAELEKGMGLLDQIAVERAPDEVENVQLASQRDLVITRLDREAVLLGAVREALGRIEDGSYGLCVDCGREIRRARLKAVPWASRCVPCQEAEDRRARETGSHENLEAA